MGCLRDKRLHTIASLLSALAINEALASPSDEDFSLSPSNAANLPLVTSRAESGNCKAQMRLGNYYLATGDFTNAVAWYRKAANQGEIEAQLSLASCCLAGRGTARDPKAAAQLLRAAAAHLENSRDESGAAQISAHASLPPTARPLAPSRAVPVSAPPLPDTNVATSRVQRVLDVQAPLLSLLESAPQPRLVRATP